MKLKIATFCAMATIVLAIAGYVWWDAETDRAEDDRIAEIFGADEAEPANRTGQYVVFGLAGFAALSAVIMFAGSGDPKPAAGTPRLSDEIADLKRLHVAGDLSDEQFESAKERLVERYSGGTP